MDASAPLAVRLLGGFRVAIATHEMPAVAWRQRRAAAVVKLLALAPGHRLHREELSEALWPDLDPDAAANNLRVALHRARSRFEAAGAPAGRFLVRDGETILLGSPETAWVDVDAFESAAAKAWRSDLPASTDEALARYAGDLLPEDPYEDWVASRRSGLRTAFLALLARLAHLHEQRGERDSAIAVLRRLLAAEPLDEAAHTDLIRLLALSGRARQAGEEYDRFAALLAAELGAEPEPATRALVAEIRDGRFPPASDLGAASRPAALRETAPPADPHRPERPAALGDTPASTGSTTAATPVHPTGNLPHPTDEIIGREREIAELRRFLRTRRLVTLTGPGGVGKTRLALAAVEPERERSGDVHLVDLAPVRDPDLVLPTVARTVGVHEAVPASIVEAMAAQLTGRRTLLLLDNFEHLTPAAPIVGSLLAACADLRIVATSRSPLRLRGEQEYPVAPLALPTADDQVFPYRPLASLPGGAVARLADAGRVECRDEMRLSAADAASYPAVALFVRRAERARPDFVLTDANVESVVGICRRLDGLPLALELAAARVRLLPPAALLARLDRPFALLTGGPGDAPARQQTLWATIAWSFDLLSAEEQALFRRLAVFVGGFTLDAAETVASRGVEESTPALDLLAALVDQSVLRQAVGVDATPRFSMLETIHEFAAEHLRGSPEAAAVRQRHAAFFLALAEEAAPALTGAGAAAWLDRLDLEHPNLRAALGWFEAGAGEESTAALRLAAALWRFWWLRGYLGEGRRWLARALARGAAAPAAVRADALDSAGALAEAQGEQARAIALHLDALRLRRETGDRRGMVRTLVHLGLAADEQGDPRQAAAWLEEALAVARDVGDRRGVAGALANLGQVAMTEDAFEVATARFGESAAIFRELGDERSLAAILANLGVLAFFAGDLARAEQGHEEALRLLRGLGDRQGEADELLNLGHVVQRRGDLEYANALFGEALDRYERLGDRSGTAFALTHLGRLAHLRGDDDAAEALIGEGLAVGRQIEDRVAVVEAIEGLIAVAGARGQAERGAQLIGAATALREAIGVPLPAIHRADHELTVAAIRASLDEPAFAAALAAGAAAGVDQVAARPLALGATER